jgi:hypothetical protein
MNLVQNLSLLHQKQYSKIKKAIPPTADIPPLRLQMYLKPELLNPNPSPSLSITPE